MNLPDPMTVEEGLQTLERLGQAVEVAKSALKTGPWRPSDENPQEVWGYPAHIVIGGHFVILDLERLQKSGLPHQDRITQLEAACAAMREALESVVGHANRRQLIATEGTEDPELHRLDEPDFVLLCKQALSANAGKSLLDRLQAVEAERDRYKVALEKFANHFESGWSISVETPGQIVGLAERIAQQALQPAQMPCTPTITAPPISMR